MKQSIFFLGVSLLIFAVGLEANILPIVNTTSVCSSKSPCELKWTEDGNAPKLTESPPVNVQLMTGPNTNQIKVLDLGPVLPTVGKLVYNIPSNMGPPGKYYFYTFNAVGSNPIWSARFTIQDINGSIPGFDPTSINAQGDLTTASTPSAASNSTAPSSTAAAATYNSASSMLSVNTVTAMGMIAMAAVHLY